MKINIKTLRGQNIELDVQPSTTVAALKALIAAKDQDHPIETQKLIALGKIMDDGSKTMTDFKVVEKSNIVLMTLKAKPTKSAALEETKQSQSMPIPTVASSSGQAVQASC